MDFPKSPLIAISSAGMLTGLALRPLVADTTNPQPQSAQSQSSAEQPKSGANDLRKSASWNWPTVAIFEQHLLSYLDQRNEKTEIRDAVRKAWDATADQTKGPALLDRLLNVCSAIEPRVAQLNAQLSDPQSPVVHPRELEWLATDVPGWMQDTIRLACGRA